MGKVVDWLIHLKKTCKVCQGTGIVTCTCNNNYEIPCPNCEGQGTVVMPVVMTEQIEKPCDNPNCQEGKVPCRLCKGLGTDGQGQPCGQCGGSGKEACPICAGVGRIKVETQQTWHRHEQCPVCHGQRVIACPHCQSTKSRVCPDCHGAGEKLDVTKLAIMGAGGLAIILNPVLFMVFAGLAIAGMGLFLAYKRFPPPAQKVAEAEQEPKCGWHPYDDSNGEDF